MDKRDFSEEAIKRVKNDPSMLRNICILAHVDHGKTTLTDSLISSDKVINQVISQKLAGNIKYMDSRPDEQLRMITMKSSSVTLLYPKTEQLSPKQIEEGIEPKTEIYKINLMDSPGHVDFTNEVSSALRLSDGALVLIDVNEGVSPQSITVLRQAWDEKIRTCLVLNKIDRLIVDRGMDAEGIYLHCKTIIEQVNVIISSYINEVSMQSHNETENKKVENEDEDDITDELENAFFFSPENGNVAYVSAMGFWGISRATFSATSTTVKRIAKKLDLDPKVCAKCIWSEIYYSNKKISKKPFNKNSKIMFVQFVLEPLVNEYQKIFENLTDLSTDSLSKAHSKVSSVLYKRLPIDSCIFTMVINKLPSPKKHQKERIDVFCPVLHNIYETGNKQLENIKDEGLQSIMQERINIANSIHDWDASSEAPVVAYISKMQPISSKTYALAVKRPEEEKYEGRLLGFGRVFSGVLKAGAQMYVFGPKHSDEMPDICTVTINDIFVFKGANNIKAVPEITAGNVIGIGGLDNAILKMGTISSSKHCPSFAPSKLLGTGLIKVAILPKNIKEMPMLIEGLQKLNRADPSVSYNINEKGEYILETWGQIHLERCIKDLDDDYAQIEIEISEPIITFKETIILNNLRHESDFDTTEKEGDWFEQSEELTQKKEWFDKKAQGKGRKKDDSDSEEDKKETEDKDEDGIKIFEEEKGDHTDMYIERIMAMKDIKLRNSFKKTQGCSIGETANHKLKVRVRVVSIPFELLKWLEAHEKQLEIMNHIISTWWKHDILSSLELEVKDTEAFIESFKQKLIDTKTSNRVLKIMNKKLVCFGPKRIGPNILINQLLDDSECLFERFERLKAHVFKDGIKDEIKEDTKTSEPNEEIKEEQQDDTSQSKKLTYHELKQKRRLRKLDATCKWFKVNKNELNSAITTGFDYAWNNGPMLGEPILGAWFVIDEVEVIDPLAKEFLINHKQEYEGETEESKVEPLENEKNNYEEEKVAPETDSTSKDPKSNISVGSYTDTYGPITGQIMSWVRNLCKRAFLNAEPRLVEGYYKWELQASSENLGKIYDVVGMTRSKVLEEELQNNSELFLLKILVPVHSYNFADLIRNKDCGIPHPQLVFYGWEINNLDPFHVPMTDDEIEEFGDQELPSNFAKQIIDRCRIRKSLPIEKKLVEEASKQSTLSK